MTSNNLGGRYGYAATPGPRGCSCLLPILPEAQRYSLVGAQANRLAKIADMKCQNVKKPRPERPKCKEIKAQKAKTKGKQGPKGQNERNQPSPGGAPSQQKPLGLGCLPLTGNAVATGHDAKAWRQRPSFTWAFTCVLFSRSRSSGRFGL